MRNLSKFHSYLVIMQNLKLRKQNFSKREKEKKNLCYKIEWKDLKQLTKNTIIQNKNSFIHSFIQFSPLVHSLFSFIHLKNNKFEKKI